MLYTIPLRELDEEVECKIWESADRFMLVRAENATRIGEFNNADECGSRISRIGAQVLDIVEGNAVGEMSEALSALMEARDVHNLHDERFKELWERFSSVAP